MRWRRAGASAGSDSTGTDCYGGAADDHCGASITPASHADHQPSNGCA
jgi:hypothetical protein